jgi:hypothetical protein
MGGFLAVYKAERAPEPNPVQAPHRAASSPEAKRVPRLLHTPGALPWKGNPVSLHSAKHDFGYRQPFTIQIELMFLIVTNN